MWWRFFRDSVILVNGAIGTGKTLLAKTFINDSCQKGNRAIFFALEESQVQLIRNAKLCGIDLAKWERQGNLKIICRYPEILSITIHLLCLKKQIETFKPQRIAVDSLSALVRSGTLKSFREFVVNLTAYVKARKIDLLFTNTTPTLTSGESISEDHASAVTGTIIMLRYVEPQGEIKRGIAVIKMKGAWHDKHIREFSIDNEGIHIGAAFTGVENILRGSPCTSL